MDPTIVRSRQKSVELVLLEYCTRRQCKLFGSFFEFSAKAGSYRRELLGLLAIHTLIAAIEAYYLLGETKGKLCCDNQGALHKSKFLWGRRVRLGTSKTACTLSWTTSG